MVKYLNTLILFVFIVISFPGNAQTAKCHKPERLINTFNLHHYAPMPLGDSLSLRIYNNFFEQVDMGTEYLSLEDIEEFSSYKFQLDDLIKSGSCDFLNKSRDKIKSEILKYKVWLDDISLEKLLLDKEEFLEFVSKRNVPKSEMDMQDRWRRNIKFEYLSLTYAYDQLKDSVDYYNDMDPFQVMMDRERCRIEKALNPPEGFEQKIHSTFMKAITLSYDPHSYYLSAYEKQVFNARLSVESKGFGINVTQNILGETEIAQLVPGGAAWKAEILEKGDVITLIKGNDNTVYDLYCSSLDETQTLLNASPYDAITITVRKENNEIHTVLLNSSSTPMESNTLKSFVFNGEKKIGYIGIPSFYTSYDPNNPTKGLSDDLAKELLQLKREKIEGIILDLRSNGGGSLEEAVKIAGIFIDKGPVLAIEQSGSQVHVINDFNRGTLYSGPLLLLVNGNSASASELLAACIQDYGRGLVVGNSTFGKSTAQQMFPAYSEQEPHTADEFVSLTTEVFYRVTGESHQGDGVIPDIELPEIFSGFNQKESDYESVLMPKGIEKEISYTSSILPKDILKQNSENRVKADPSFQLINRLKDSLAVDETYLLRIPLNHSSFFVDFNDVLDRWRFIEEASFTNHDQYKVDIPEYKESLLKYDKVKDEDYQVTKKYVSRDVYLKESFNIISDLINYKK